MPCPMPIHRAGRAAVLALALGLAAPTDAHETTPLYDRVTFSSEASARVENDRLVASLYSQQEGQEQSALASRVNQDIGWAARIAKSTPGIEVQTEQYRTNPIYQRQTLTGWRVIQSIRLESENSAALADLVGKLQSKLSVRSIGYDVSPAARMAAENDLIGRALEAFGVRARLIAEGLGRRGYRVVNIDVGTAGHRPPPVRMMRAGVAAMEASVPPPTLEAGEQTLTVRVHGTVELDPIQ